MKSIRDSLISAGIANMKEFGYPYVNETNILTDEVYSTFFRSMLKENLGHGVGVDDVIHSLMAEIDAAKA